MKRVAIIGSPGTGKSTFARQLATKTILPLIHLGYYYHDTQQNYYTDKDAWHSRVRELSQSDAWIIDGNFSRALPERLERADTIFYFDMPTYLALKGIIKRWITAKSTKRLDMPDDWQEKPSYKLFEYVLKFRTKHASATKQLLDQTHNNTHIVIFKNHKQVYAYLQSIEQL